MTRGNEGLRARSAPLDICEVIDELGTKIEALEVGELESNELFTNLVTLDMLNIIEESNNELEPAVGVGERD